MSYPSFIIGGLVFGERTIKIEGKMHLFDCKNRLFTEIVFNDTIKGKFND